MLKNAEVKERLNNMIGQELTNINLAKAVLFDKVKCLKRQLENYQSYITYEIVKTPEGPWGKIYLTGNPTEFRVDLEKKDGKYYIKNVEMHWLEIAAIENDTTIYQIAKEGDLQEATLYNMIRRNTPFDKITIKTLNGICKGLGLTEFEFLTKYRDRFVKPITITIYECINCGTTYHKSDLHEGEEQCRLCHAVLQEKEVELEYEE